MTQLSNLTMVIQDKRYQTDPEWGVPCQKSAGAAGMDLRACIDSPVALGLTPTKIGLGIAVAIPVGYVGLLIPRSSMGSCGLELVNTTGVIDSDYRGELIAQVRNKLADTTELRIRPGDRIVQLVIVPAVTFATITYKENFDENEATARGEGGFGSTGVK